MQKLLARASVMVLEGNKRDYLEVAEQTNLAISNYEKKTLAHYFYEDYNSQNSFKWIIIYQDFEALLSYFASPIFALYYANHQILGSQYQLEIYGEISKEEEHKLSKIGIPVKCLKTRFGYDQPID